MCVIFSCRCVFWIDGSSFTTCGYRVPGIPLGTYCNCRRFWSSSLVRVVKLNHQFSCHYIWLMWHWGRIVSQPIFVFCMFPMCSLQRSQKHLRFHPIIVLQTSNFIYITRRREGGTGKHDKACFHFGERFYVWECPIFENIGDGRSNDSFWKKKKKKRN
jgi:hypothetical protein